MQSPLLSASNGKRDADDRDQDHVEGSDRFELQAAVNRKASSAAAAAALKQNGISRDGRRGGRNKKAIDPESDRGRDDVSNSYGMRAMNATTDASSCSICGAHFHWLCARKYQCATCNSHVCRSCAPAASGSVRFCKVCEHDPKQEYSRLSAVLQRYPHDAEVWAAVANEMHDEYSIVMVDDQTYSQAACYARAIELNPGRRHWAPLARALPGGGYVDLTIKNKGTYRLSKLACYANALYVRPNDTRIWTNLASDLVGFQSVEINGAVYNKISAILHALEISDYESAAAWALLGSEIHSLRSRDYVWVRTRRYSALECFEESLRIDPNRAATWNNAASILAPTPYWRDGAGDDDARQQRVVLSSCCGGDHSMSTHFASVHGGGNGSGGGGGSVLGATTNDAAAANNGSTHHANGDGSGSAPHGNGNNNGKNGSNGNGHAPIGPSSTGAATASANNGSSFAIAATWSMVAAPTNGSAAGPGRRPQRGKSTVKVTCSHRQHHDVHRRYIEVGGRKYFKMDCALEALRLAPNDCRIRFNLASLVCPEHPVVIRGRAVTKADLLQQVVDDASRIRSINVRTQLMIVFPDHPRLVGLNARYGFDEAKPLGNGAYGSVFEAYYDDCVTQTRQENLAAKVIENFGVEDHRQSMLESTDEVRALIDVRFSKGNIVQCRHLVVDAVRDRLIIYMERAEGSLNDRVKGRVAFDDTRFLYKKLSRSKPTATTNGVDPVTAAAAAAPPYRLHESEIRVCAARVLQCLEEMHYLSVAHQDIKPDNVLLFDNGAIKLGDLGSVAEVRGGKRKPGGTDPYLAPEALREIADPHYLREQLEAEAARPHEIGRVFVKRDVWSWAALVVHLGSGRVPIKTVPIQYNRATKDFSVQFSESEGYQPLFPSEGGVPHIPATLSRGLRDLLRRCFCPNAADRPAAHELLVSPYFKRAELPMDAEPIALYESRRERYMRFLAQPNGGGGVALDPEWNLVYRVLPLFGPGADDLQGQSSSPARLRAVPGTDDPTSYSPANGEDMPATPLESPALLSSGGRQVPALSPDVLARMRNVAEGTVDMTC